jgi:hypothetical protein
MKTKYILKVFFFNSPNMRRERLVFDMKFFCYFSFSYFSLALNDEIRSNYLFSPLILQVITVLELFQDHVYRKFLKDL